jgi:hypothetical protein
VIEFSRPFLRGFGFRQINLHLRLILFERRRYDEKYQEDDENIDQRNDDDHGRPAFSH